MTSRQWINWAVAGWSVLLLATLFRMFYAGTFLLVPDEAYYWQWSRHPAAGYYDHPPMIAWCIRLSTLLLGHNETAVRMPAVAALGVASAYLLAIARRWFAPRVVGYTALLSQGILGLNAAGLIATPDSPQMAAWAGAVYHLARAYENGTLTQWLLGGAWFGIGLLSKYTMVLLPPLIFAWGLFHADHRRRLATAGPWIGLAVGVLLFTPVVWWNAHNNWYTFRHVAYKGGVDRAAVLRFDTLLEFIGAQAALLTPVVFVMLLVIWFRPLSRLERNRCWVPAYLFFTSFPVVGAFLLLSLHTRVEGNWAASGYLTAAVICAYYAVQARKSPARTRAERFLKRLWPWAVGSAALLSALLLLQLYYPLVPLPAGMDRLTKETGGWDRLARRAYLALTAMPNPDRTFVFGMNYQTASQLAFYMPGRPETRAVNRWKRPNAYDTWHADADVLGWDAVGIGRASAKDLARLRLIFASVAPPERMDIYARPAAAEPAASYFLYRATGFKGGLHWQPADKGDVRAF